MRIKQMIQILTLTAGAMLYSASALQADSLDTPATNPASQLKANIMQPYIVKKGDTLWDIAQHFFRDPMQWLKIWEKNLYITNPDLIYPGNKIWFDGKRLRQGGLSLLKPQVIVKAVERLHPQIDSSLLLTALQRQDLIHPDQLQGVGYVLDSKDERINYGVHDQVYVKLPQAAKAGTVFDVFRSGDSIRDLRTGKNVGILVEHMGQIKIVASAGPVYRAVVIKAFKEISRGDRLKPARDISGRITPVHSEQALSGSVIYIRNHAQEAAQHQVIGISLGSQDGLKTGTSMTILKAGRLVADQVAGGSTLLPQEPVGELLVLAAQPHASIALITQSTAPIHIGDAVQTSTAP